MERVDTVIKNVQVFNSYFKKFFKADVYLLDGKFYYIDEKQEDSLRADEVIDGKARYMIPGLIDIHMHIESSMLTPGPFSRHLASCGVTTIVSEPHEIANVKGMRGIEEMIKAGEESIIDVFYGIPSSVPSTNERLETTGGKIDYQDMLDLMNYEKIVCVGEVMNYREIIRENDLDITKFIKYLNDKHPNYIIEGHCPSLLDLDLAKFLYLGINGDHTEHTLEEIKQRFKNGMFVEIQDKMLRKEIIDFIIDNNLYEHCSFVTDDVMADELYREGHLNKVVKRAIDMGFPLEEAIYCSSYTSAMRMNLRDRGVIAPGKIGDFILMDSLEDFTIDEVYKNAKAIFPYESVENKEDYTFPEDFYTSVKLDKLSEENFSLKLDTSKDKIRLRVMEIRDGSTHIREAEAVLPVRNGEIIWENSGYNLIAVFERYGKNGSVGYGLVHGDGLKEGAVASTWVHDHHNLLVLGSDKKTMVETANRLIESQGGFAVGIKGQVLDSLDLPIGGIMSDKSVEEVGKKLENIRDLMIQQGYNHYNPIMSLGTLGLVVSPYIKITDQGLVDVEKGEILDLIKD